MGIIGAMDVEIALLREEMAKAGAVKITRIAGMEFNVGTIGNATVIVVQCGVGMVNAATCAQVLVDRFGDVALGLGATRHAVRGDKAQDKQLRIRQRALAVRKRDVAIDLSRGLSGHLSHHSPSP